MNVIADALDTLGLALVEHGHKWTRRQRQLYEQAISFLCRKEIGLSASRKSPSLTPSRKSHRASCRGEARSRA